MKAPTYNPATLNGFRYLLLAITGILIILLCSTIQHVPPPSKGEYYYSTFFRNNFTLLIKVLFFIIGFLAGYFYKLNPWLTGICLILIFPFTAIIEAIIYTGSHNLIPFEFAYHLWLALPAIAAVYIGRFVVTQVAKQRAKSGREY